MHFSSLLEGNFQAFQHAFQSHELTLDSMFYLGLSDVFKEIKIQVPMFYIQDLAHSHPSVPSGGLLVYSDPVFLVCRGAWQPL